MGILIPFDAYRASGALTQRLRKLRTIELQTRASERSIPVLVKSPMTSLFCLCAGNATGFSTRLGRRLFGVVASLYFGRWRFTRQKITKNGSGSSRRHYGFSGDW